jgi:hypothetical protein
MSASIAIQGVNPSVYANEAQQIYVDPLNGKDYNSGRRRDRPVQSGLRIKELIASAGAAQVTVHLTSRGLLMDESGVFLRSSLMRGRAITLFADEAWDPAVVTVNVTATAADAGTTATVLKGTFVADALEGLTVELLTTGGGTVPVPLGQRQRRTIRNNTTTDIVPQASFVPAPVPGDTFRVITEDCWLTCPVLPGGALYQTYVVAEDMPSQPGSEPIFPFFGLTNGSFATVPGLALEGVGLRCSSSFLNMAFGRLPLYLYGTRFDPNGAIFGALTPIFNGTQVGGGLGLNERATQYIGYGPILSHGMTLGRSAYFTGFVWCTDIGGVFDTTSLVSIYGGRMRRFFGPGGRVKIQASFGIPFLFNGRGVTGDFIRVTGFGGSGPCVLNTQGNVEVINAPANQPAINIDIGGEMTLDSGFVGTGGAGGSAVLVQGGGSLGLADAPAFGDAVATDWDVINTAAVNKSAFAAANSGLMDPATGSRIYRSS